MGPKPQGEVNILTQWWDWVSSYARPVDKAATYGAVLRLDQWGRVNGAWTCHKWEQLPEGSDITCGYVSLIMPPPPEGTPDPSYPIWACTKGLNALPYSEPYSVTCDYYNQDTLDRLVALGVKVLSYEPSEVDAWTKAFNSLFSVYGYDQILATS
jgi:hypothetical protein